MGFLVSRNNGRSVPIRLKNWFNDPLNGQHANTKHIFNSLIWHPSEGFSLAMWDVAFCEISDFVFREVWPKFFGGGHVHIHV